MKTIICGIPVSIVQRATNTKDDNNYGRFSGKEALITLDKTMPKAIQEATLVHEWVHGVLEYNGIDHGEILVAVLATELYRSGYRVKLVK